MNTQKGFLKIIVIIVGLLVIGGGVYFYTNNNDVTNEAQNDEGSNMAIDSVSEPFISEINKGNPVYPGDTILIEGGNFSGVSFSVGLTPSFKIPSVEDIKLPHYELTGNSFTIKIPNDIDTNLHGGYHIYIETKDGNRIKEPFNDIYPLRDNDGNESLEDNVEHKSTITDWESVSIEYDLYEDESNYLGFWFSDENPSVTHPITKNIINKKTQLSEEDLIIDGTKFGDIVQRNEDSIIVELPAGGCLAGSPYPSVYVYNSENDNKNYALIFNRDLKFDVSDKINNIKKYANEISLQEEKKTIVISEPPADVIRDGWYYVYVNKYYPESNKIDVDFASLSENEYSNLYNKALTDVLMNYTNYNSDITLNVSLENNNEKNRTLEITEEAKEQTRIVGGSEEYVQYLIRIVDNIITDITQVNSAC